MQKSSKEKLVRYIKDQDGIGRYASILNAGFHPETIRCLEKEGKVVKAARGLYRLADRSFGAYPDLVLVSLQAPRGVICLLSALYFHEATTEIPRSVSIAIPAGSRANKVAYPPVTFYRFAPAAYNAGIEERRIDGHTIRVYSLAKAVADCFKFRNKIGIDVARSALKIAVAEKGIRPQEIIQYAKVCRVDGIIKPLLEIMQ